MRSGRMHAAALPALLSVSEVAVARPDPNVAPSIPPAGEFFGSALLTLLVGALLVAVAPGSSTPSSTGSTTTRSPRSAWASSR
ncbi:MAG: hypothetical protein V5A23_07160 [Halobacteriales archaeon]